MRTVAEIEAEYETASKAVKVAIKCKEALSEELNAARVAAAVPPLPVGTKVKRTISTGFGKRERQKIQRGLVAVYDPIAHRGIRGLPYDRKAGDIIVVSPSGLTGYKFTPGRYDERVPWEIDA